MRMRWTYGTGLAALLSQCWRRRCVPDHEHVSGSGQSADMPASGSRALMCRSMWRSCAGPWAMMMSSAQHTRLRWMPSKATPQFCAAAISSFFIQMSCSTSCDEQRGAAANTLLKPLGPNDAGIGRLSNSMRHKTAACRYPLRTTRRNHSWRTRGRELSLRKMRATFVLRSFWCARRAKKPAQDAMCGELEESGCGTMQRRRRSAKPMKQARWHPEAGQNGGIQGGPAHPKHWKQAHQGSQPTPRER